jgi:hypothetical protein
MPEIRGGKESEIEGEEIFAKKDSPFALRSPSAHHAFIAIRSADTSLRSPKTA